jgi:hypothetical protein
MIDKLEAAAKRALAHRDLQDIIRVVPAAERDNPAALRSWLTIAAGIDRSREPAINAALEALQPVEHARNLRDQAARLYHDPALRARYGADKVEAAWADPETARELLLRESAAGRLPQEGHDALTALYEVRELAAEHGAPLPAVAEVPIPSGVDGQEQERLALLGKSRKTEAEHQRLTQLSTKRR